MENLPTSRRLKTAPARVLGASWLLGRASGARMTVIAFVWALAFVSQITIVFLPSARAASDLRLAPDLSFDDDSSPNFPIDGRDLPKGVLPSQAATVIFLERQTAGILHARPNVW